MLVDNSDPRSFSGQSLHDAENELIGRIDAVYEDGLNPHTYWAAVDLATEPGTMVAVPAADIRPGPGGATVSYTRAVVTGAPRVQPSSGEIAGADARALYEHYRDNPTTIPAPPPGEETIPQPPA